MAKTLISSPPFITTTPHPSLSRHGLLHPLPRRTTRLLSTRVKLSFHDLPPIPSFDSSADFSAIKNGGWFSFIADGMEVVLKLAKKSEIPKHDLPIRFANHGKYVATGTLWCGDFVCVPKVLKDGLTAVHVPYAYGFAIILLTVIVKLVTFPLTKQQVESSLAMQNLQPKIKAIQERYKGNQERIQLETSRLYKQAGVNPLAGCFPTLATIPVWIGLYQALSNVANEGLLTEGFFWIPSLGGPTTIAARQSGSGISWLFPFVDGHPPLGWHDTAAYLVLPVLLVASQFVSMEIMKPPQSDDPAQKNTLLVFKFLPLMIGYFSLSVPSGLSIYWFTNNVLSTAQQVWLKQLGGAKPVVSKNASGIISAGRAKRSGSQPTPTGDRFRQLKEEEKKKKLNEALPAEQVEVLASTSESEDGSDEVTNATVKSNLQLLIYAVKISSHPDSNSWLKEVLSWKRWIRNGSFEFPLPVTSLESRCSGGPDVEALDGVYASNGSKPLPDYSKPKRSKRSKRKRAV
ncbi:hypothetical protein RHSIM_Rhsim01G0226500 [Rhododendron simsii]|uniref:Membrane insertase YidC/Oxa/ALB C-terminal domain-containing protein n=1 Tax=Rhododendron simsii TaxID=118357 RepID=A0A834HR18_RHOSS|nr:hypothetical protein RHSIM_Rhsim01G0226500 [Rhododendron simsii]